MWQKIVTYVKTNKKKIIFGLIILVIAGWYFYQKSQAGTVTPSYVMGTVAKGDIIVSVSGTGQVSASNQVEVKPKVTANIIAVKVKEQAKVKAGQIIAELDNKDLKSQAEQARNSLASARANLSLKLVGPTKEDIALSKKSIESARLAYEAAQRSLGTTEATLAQNLKKAQQQLANAQIQFANDQSTQGIDTTSADQSLANTYESAKNTVNSAVLSMRTAVQSADSILGIDRPSVVVNKTTFGALNSQSLSDAQSAYQVAKVALAQAEQQYNSVSVNWDRTQEESLVKNLIDYIQKIKALNHATYLMLINTISSSELTLTVLDGYRQQMSTQENTMLTTLSNLQSASQSIANAKLNNATSGVSLSNNAVSANTALENAKTNLDQVVLDNKKSLDQAQLDIANKKISYDNAKLNYDIKVAKPRPEDVASLQASVAQAANAYQNALDNLAEATIKSPIDGVVAILSAKVGDQAAPGTAIATVITTDQVADISLNEVDAAKIKNGQKANLTFSAIDTLEISGSVVSIDTIGTVTQNVVNYTAKIALDTGDERIKPGMSVSASIVTDKKFDVITIPVAAVKTQNNSSYVETLPADVLAAASSTSGAISTQISPIKKTIQTGLANDTDIEVTQGLNVGDVIITKTIAAGTQTTAASSQNALRMLGGGGNTQRAAGGAARGF